MNGELRSGTSRPASASKWRLVKESGGLPRKQIRGRVKKAGARDFHPGHRLVKRRLIGTAAGRYQIRSRRGGQVTAGEILEELVERAVDRKNDRPKFYRSARRTRPGVEVIVGRIMAW